MSEPTPENLERLWGSFLKNANKLGYVVKANDTINFGPKFNNSCEVGGRVTLCAPSSLELVELGYKPSYTLPAEVRKKYEMERSSAT